VELLIGERLAAAVDGGPLRETGGGFDKQPAEVARLGEGPMLVEIDLQKRVAALVAFRAEFADEALERQVLV
jgi:hypothetical protein